MIRIEGTNSNPTDLFQAGDFSAYVEQYEPLVTCTFTNVKGQVPRNSYLKVEKVVVDKTGGTQLPQGYTFPLWLSCSNSPFGGTWVPIPLAANTCSSNDPNAGCGPVTAPPSIPYMTCKVTENVGAALPLGSHPLPPIPSTPCGGYAAWTTTYSKPGGPYIGKTAVPASGTATLTVTNTLDCVSATTGSYVDVSFVKVVVNATPIALPPMRFTFKLNCTPIPSALASNWTNSGTIPGGTTVQLPAGATFDAAIGDSCTPTEDPPAVPAVAQSYCASLSKNAVWTTAFSPATIKITTNTWYKATVTNTLACM